jgi:hypothetical protein
MLYTLFVDTFIIFKHTSFTSQFTDIQQIIFCPVTILSCVVSRTAARYKNTCHRSQLHVPTFKVVRNVVAVDVIEFKGINIWSVAYYTLHTELKRKFVSVKGDRQRRIDTPYEQPVKMV